MQVCRLMVLSLVYFVGLWFYCNSFIDNFICNIVLPQIILYVLAS